GRKNGSMTSNPTGFCGNRTRICVLSPLLYPCNQYYPWLNFLAVNNPGWQSSFQDPLSQPAILIMAILPRLAWPEFRHDIAATRE
ncbi:MAG: hypothetical protein ACOCVH_03090, partial [Verrucomicrobiota bacterium]